MALPELLKNLAGELSKFQIKVPEKKRQQPSPEAIASVDKIFEGLKGTGKAIEEAVVSPASLLLSWPIQKIAEKEALRTPLELTSKTAGSTLAGSSKGSVVPYLMAAGFLGDVLAPGPGGELKALKEFSKPGKILKATTPERTVTRVGKELVERDVVDVRNEIEQLRSISRPVDPLLSEARKYKSAEEFVKAQGKPVYHGTNQDFDVFNKVSRGNMTKAVSAKRGTFFTDSIDEAGAYAELADKRLVANESTFNKTLKKMQNEQAKAEAKAQITRSSADWKKSEDLTAKIEDFYFNQTRDNPVKNAKVVEGYVKLNNPLVVDFAGDSALDSTTGGISNLILKAKRLGHDGLVMKNISDSPTKMANPTTHTVVFDPSQIKTKSQLTSIWEKANKGGADSSKLNIGQISRLKSLEGSLERSYNIDELRAMTTELAKKPLKSGELKPTAKAELGLRTVIAPSEGGLKKLGNEGDILFRRSQAAVDDAERQTGEFMDRYKTLAATISPEERASIIFKTLEGKALPTTRQGYRLSQFLKEEFQKVIGVAKSSGVKARLETSEKIGVRARKNYVPHVLDETKISTPEGRALALEHLIRTGQTKNLQRAGTLLNATELKAFKGVPSLQKAEILLNKFILKQKTGGIFFGPLSRVRTLDLPPELLVTDIDRLVGGYFPKAHQFLSNTRQFGQANEKVAPLLKKIAEEKGESGAAFARQFIMNITDGANINSSKFVDDILAFNVTTKLGQSVIANLGQSTLTAVMGGVWNTIKNTPALFTPAGRKFVSESGSLVNSITRELLKQTASGGSKVANSVLTASGFNAVETKINRSLAALTARSYLDDIYNTLKKNPKNSFALRKLEELRINPEALLKTGPIDKLQKQAALRMTKITQFGEGVRQMPLWAAEPGLPRLFYQFKQFSISSTRFIVNQVMREAAKGNVAPLIRTLIVAQIPGEILNDIVSVVRGRQRTDSPAQRYLENLTYVGVLGIFYDLIRSASYGKAAANLAGPTIGTIADIIEPTVRGDVASLAKTGLRTIPIAGPSLPSLVLPTKEQKKAQKKEGFVKSRLQPVTSAVDTLKNLLEGDLLPGSKKKKTAPTSL